MTPLADSITRRFLGSYERGSASHRMRSRRHALLESLFPALPEMTVLDIGGDARFWRLAPTRPAHVTVLNVYPQEAEEPWITALTGDGCDPGLDLPGADLAFSNSVIEHVGGHWRRERFAERVRAAAPRHWVQTPYRYFPIEPHYLCPGIQLLPVPLRAAVLRRWPIGSFAAARKLGYGRALTSVMNIELLTATQMRAYFPDAELHRERFAGLTKSLVAVRG